MPGCSANSCTNRHIRKSQMNERNKKITFHRFPHDPIKRKVWIEIMKLNPDKVKKFSVLCSNHFAESSIDRTSLAVVRLRENAVPLGPIKEEETALTEEIDDNTMRTEVSNNDHSYNSKYFQMPSLIHSVKVNERRKIMPLRTNNEVVKVMNTQPDIFVQIGPEVKAPFAPPIQYIIQSIKPTPPTVERVDRSTCVSPVRVFNSPEVVRVRDAMKYMKDQYKKKIAMLQQKNRRLEKQVTDLKNLVQELHDKHLVKVVK